MVHTAQLSLPIDRAASWRERDIVGAPKSGARLPGRRRRAPSECGTGGRPGNSVDTCRPELDAVLARIAQKQRRNENAATRMAVSDRAEKSTGYSEGFAASDAQRRYSRGGSAREEERRRRDAVTIDARGQQRVTAKMQGKPYERYRQRPSAPCDVRERDRAQSVMEPLATATRPWVRVHLSDAAKIGVGANAMRSRHEARDAGTSAPASRPASMAG